MLREQHDGERYSGGLKGRWLFPLRLELRVCLLYRCWKLITVKCEKEHKDILVKWLLKVL